MKKILMFVIIGFLLIVTAIGVGGKMYMDKRAEQKEGEKIEAERMSIEALKNTLKILNQWSWKRVHIMK